jgi:hypothetical protein
MKKSFRVLSAIVASFLVTGCMTLRKSDPQVLLDDKYKSVKYVSHVPDGFVIKEEVSVTTSGYQAGILFSIPDLYKQALEKKAKEAATVNITNLKINNYVKQEPFQQSYQDCRNETRYQNQSYQNCSGYGSSHRCSTSYRQVPVSEQVCQTRYRTVIANVLYQQVTADVIGQKD